jgi:CBS domain-containing protein
MTKSANSDSPAPDDAGVELSDEDILDAMSRIPGYLDITTADFLAIYRFARQHAMERMFGRIRAANLMRTAVPVLSADMMLDEAAKSIAASGYKGLPVVDSGGKLIGMLTETDFLRRLDARSFLELLLRLMDDSCELSHRCHETPVSAGMTSPAVAVSLDAGYTEIGAAFRGHAGRSVPVLDTAGRPCGLLLRKDFIAALDLDGPF